MKKLNIRILSSLVVIALMSMALGLGATAYFSDTETSTGNTFTAGTLDLEIDDVNTNVVKWAVTNFRPGNQPIRVFKLTNVGSLTGYLDVENIVVTEAENGRLDPEIEAGDTTDAEGELGSCVKINFFTSPNNSPWYEAGDVKFQTDIFIADLPSNYELDFELAAGATVYIVAQVNWWSTANDNQAQSDSLQLDIEFELGQTTGQ